MKRIIGLLGSIILYACVATVLAQAVGLGMLWYKGYVTEDRVYALLAGAHGIDRVAIHERLEREKKADSRESPSYESAMEHFVRKGLDLDVREMTVDKGLIELINLQSSLQVEHTRFLDVKNKYDSKLVEIADEAKNESLQKLQSTVEAMTPEQAKDQLLKMYKDGAMNDVVKVLLGLPTDKLKKILAQFANDEESEQLYEILKRVRLGEPTVSTIDQARAELDELNLANVLDKQ